MKRTFIAVTFLITWALLLGFSWAEGEPNPMGKYSTNPTLAEVMEQFEKLVYSRPDLTNGEIMDLAIKRAYEKKNGRVI